MIVRHAGKLYRAVACVDGFNLYSFGALALTLTRDEGLAAINAATIEFDRARREGD